MVQSEVVVRVLQCRDVVGQAFLGGVSSVIGWGSCSHVCVHVDDAT